jgi:Asp-tRNA(Asn)/Glu-tRNA(Gln) amidotransferase C subunit
MALRDQKFWAKHPLQEEIMALSKEDRVRELARLVDISIMESEIAEVADRFDSLLQELARLTSLDLADIQPVTIFPEEE